jgi:TonB family protein
VAPTDQAAAPQGAAPAEKAATGAETKPAADTSQAGAISEEDLRRMLVGKSLYLRGGYLDNNLTFGETGQLIGHSPVGSYTLSGIQIDHVRLTKHKVELEGARYGLHFLGALPYEDPTKAVDRVKITPKKKFVKITIDRELVVTPKKKKEKGDEKNSKPKLGPGAPATPAEAKNLPAGSQPTSTAAADSTQAGSPAVVVTSADSIQASSKPSSGEAASAAPADSAQASAQPDAKEPAAGAPSNASAGASTEPTDEDQAKAELTSGPKEERPADPGSVTTTTSPAHASKILKDALDKIFAPGLDERMMASMPEFWKLYYEAAAAKTDYRPKDPTVLRQSGVDEKAKLTSKFEPESNDFAQDAGVAGMCLYHTVIDSDGRPSEIAVARPIGFGLDEKAVEAIRKASFQPAMKDGKPVPVLLDLVVQFRIYSKRTNVASKPEDKNKPAEAQLPGPYTLQSLRTTQAQAPNPSPAQSQ